MNLTEEEKALISMFDAILKGVGYNDGESLARELSKAVKKGKLKAALTAVVKVADVAYARGKKDGGSG